MSGDHKFEYGVVYAHMQARWMHRNHLFIVLWHLILLHCIVLASRSWQNRSNVNKTSILYSDFYRRILSISLLLQTLNRYSIYLQALFATIDVLLGRRKREMPLQNLNPIEPMQIDVPGEDNDNFEDDGSYTIENPTIDLDFYANSYAGFAKLNRLIFVADHCPSLRLEALKMAINYVMETYNVTLYQHLHRKIAQTRGGPLPDVAASAAGSIQSTSQNLPAYDATWIEAKAKKGAHKLEKLDNDLKNYRMNSIKESIRRGHDDLGDHYLNCGDLSNALKSYSRARDYCTSGKHVVNMCLNVIKVSIYLQNWAHVQSYVAKAESTPDFSEDSNQSIVTRLKCSSGLAYLAKKNYKNAAKSFLQANFDHCDCSEIISPSNVAMYGGLCALATYDRQEVQKHVISSSTFKLFLELEPHLRDIIFKFYESKYASCLKLLDEIEDNLLLDMYLAPHVSALYTQIRNRALVQYFSPYLSADMVKMASAFNRTVSELENEVMHLILDGQIQARIDSHNKILYAKDMDQRSCTFEKAIGVAQKYRRRTQMLILRAAVLKSQIHVKNQPRESIGQNSSNNHTAELCAASASNTQNQFRN